MIWNCNWILRWRGLPLLYLRTNLNSNSTEDVRRLQERFLVSGKETSGDKVLERQNNANRSTLFLLNKFEVVSKKILPGISAEYQSKEEHPLTQAL